MIVDLFSKTLKAVNLGNEDFATELASTGVETIHLEWEPPAGGRQDLIAALDKLSSPEVEEANKEALRRVNAAQIILEDVRPAREVVPGLDEDTILHAGPPITWERMSGPLKGAVLGALLFEKRAKTLEEAEALAKSGKVKFGPCHEHSAVGPMAGVLSPSMYVSCLKNVTFGNMAYCSLNEGLGKVLRYGAYGPEVIKRLEWMRDTLGPALQKAVRLSGGIDIRSLAAQALHMGDEVHNRNKAATSLFIRQIAPWLLKANLGDETCIEVLNFINGNDHFFLNLSMPMAKATLDAADGIPHCTMATVMARNGTDFGLRVSGLPGQWFVGPAGIVKGLLFPGYTEADCNPDIGDSAITETLGVGGFCMAAAIAIVQFVGGVPEDAVRYSQSMYEITLGESSAFSIPILDFRGAPTGIDVRKVIETGILPQINTGIAHKDAGVGQVGAGLVNPPRGIFEEALGALAK